MKIVIIPSADLSYNSGSVIYAKILFEHLVNNGHEVYMLGLCIPDDIDEKKKNMIKIKRNLLFHPIIDDRPIADVQYLKMGMDILEALTEIYTEWGSIDIIHAHYASVNSYFAVVAKHFINTKVIISSFGRDLNIGYGFSKLYRYMIDYSYERTDKIIVPEFFLKEDIMERFPRIQPDKIEICPMPLDNAVLSKGEFVEKKDEELIFSTINSCFTPEKGIDNIIEAFSRIIKKYNNCKLYIAGQDDDEHMINYYRLLELTAKLKVQNKIIFTGFLSRQDVGKLLNSTDIFIDARIQGNFSSVLLEGEFKHKVILAANNEGAKKIICDKTNGIFFERGNTDDLEKKILYLLENNELRNSLIQGTKIWCVNSGKEYTEEVCMKKILQIYKKVVA